MARLCHVSDTHGYFPRLLGKFEIVVHSGDFFPNSQYVWTNKIKEMEFQYQWLEEKIPLMKEWLQNHPFLYTLGNHDFLNSQFMEQRLNAAGIVAIDLTDKITTFEGINFYGFPYIPYIHGVWNYERTLEQMEPHIDKLCETLNKTYVDTLVSHPPPYGCLDLSNGNEHLGSTALANALDFKIAREMLPSAMLCGHIHEAASVTIRNGMLVSNAATRQFIIEI